MSYRIATIGALDAPEPSSVALEAVGLGGQGRGLVVGLVLGALLGALIVGVAR